MPHPHFLPARIGAPRWKSGCRCGRESRPEFTPIAFIRPSTNKRILAIQPRPKLKGDCHSFQSSSVRNTLAATNQRQVKASHAWKEQDGIAWRVSGRMNDDQGYLTKALIKVDGIRASKSNYSRTPVFRFNLMIHHSRETNQYGEAGRHR